MTKQNTDKSTTAAHYVATGPARLVGTAELADFVGVTPWTIREWKRRGLIEPAVVVGRVMRWDAEEVLAQLVHAHAEGRS